MRCFEQSYSTKSGPTKHDPKFIFSLPETFKTHSLSFQINGNREKSYGRMFFLGSSGVSENAGARLYKPMNELRSTRKLLQHNGEITADHKDVKHGHQRIVLATKRAILCIHINALESQDTDRKLATRKSGILRMDEREISSMFSSVEVHCCIKMYTVVYCAVQCRAGVCTCRLSH